MLKGIGLFGRQSLRQMKLLVEEAAGAGNIGVFSVDFVSDRTSSRRFSSEPNNPSMKLSTNFRDIRKVTASMRPAAWVSFHLFWGCFVALPATPWMGNIFCDSHSRRFSGEEEDRSFVRLSATRSSLVEQGARQQMDGTGIRSVSHKIFHEEIVLLFVVSSGNVKVGWEWNANVK